MISIRRTAADKKIGLTVEDLVRFVTELGHAGIDSKTPIKAMTGFRSQLQWLEVIEMAGAGKS